MAYWKRKGNYKVLKNSSVKRRRKIGHRNLTDKTARKLGRKRKKNFVNTTDKAKRKNHQRYKGSSIVDDVKKKVLFI